MKKKNSPLYFARSLLFFRVSPIYIPAENNAGVRSRKELIAKQFPAF